MIEIVDPVVLYNTNRIEKLVNATTIESYNLTLVRILEKSS